MRYQQSLLVAAAIVTAAIAQEAVYVDDKGSSSTSTMTPSVPRPGNENYVAMLASMNSMASEQAAGATASLDPAKAVFTFSPRQTDAGGS